MLNITEKDAKLHIIEGLHSHNPGYRMNNINNKQNDNQNNMGPCHACSGLHLVGDRNESMCNRCRPNLDNHTPDKCLKKRAPKRQKKSNPPFNNNSIRSQLNGHSDRNVQLSVSNNKLDNIPRLLEATK